MFLNVFWSTLMTLVSYLGLYVYILTPVTNAIIGRSRTYIEKALTDGAFFFVVVTVFAVVHVWLQYSRDPMTSIRIGKTYEEKEYSFREDLRLVVTEERRLIVFIWVASFVCQLLCRLGNLYLSGIGLAATEVFYTATIPFSYCTVFRFFGGSFGVMFMVEMLGFYLVSTAILCAVYVLVYGLYRRKCYMDVLKLRGRR